VDQHVAAGVGRTHLDQLDGLVANPDGHLALENPCRRRVPDPLELEGPEALPEELTERALVTGHRLHQGRHRLRRQLFHLLGRGHRGDDLGPLDELVAVTVIAVGVGVDEGADPARRARLGVPHGIEHLLGESQIEERIDQ
jgi:hypothetical protein